MRFFKYFFLISYFVYGDGCEDANITGVFPTIDGMNCTDYALMIAFISIISAYLFWENVTK